MTPEQASRAYDADRDGFVIAGGGGMIVAKSWSTPKPVVPGFAKSPAMVPLPMAMTWSRLR